MDGVRGWVSMHLLTNTWLLCFRSKHLHATRPKGIGGFRDVPSPQLTPVVPAVGLLLSRGSRGKSYGTLCKWSVWLPSRNRKCIGIVPRNVYDVYIYIYIYVCVCVCVRACVFEKVQQHVHSVY